MKKLNITLQDLFDMPTAQIYNPDSYKTASSVVIDSRAVKRGSMFVAIKGERFDGHEFISEAMKNGAESFVINKKYEKKFSSLNKTFVTVSDTTLALGYLAYVWRKKSSAKVIAITGSNGKTSTKDYLTTILSEKYSVHSTTANYNNHIGVPLTILSSKKKNQVMVLELGTNHFGEISYTANVASPDFAMITNIGNSHLEFLKNKAGVLKEKKSLLDVCEKNCGMIFINQDDPYLSKIQTGYTNTVTFGSTNASDHYYKVLAVTHGGKSRIEFGTKKKRIVAESNLLGEHNYKNINAAVAIALQFGLSVSQIKKGISKLKSPKQRLNLINTKVFSIIDDTYNANPESMKSALGVLSSFQNKKKFAILGDMFELGANWKKLHQNLSTAIIQNKVDEVFLLGKNMKALHSSLLKKHFPSHHFTDRDELKLFLRKFGWENSICLIKGSRGMKMEEFVKFLSETGK